MQTATHSSIQIAWLALAIVWLIAALQTKQTVRAEPAASRLGHVCTLAMAFALVFYPKLRAAWLAWRVIPDSEIAAIVALVLTFAGVTFAAWARLYLGGNWSSAVTVKVDHTLIRSGPYAMVRHPIYAGLLLALAGTAIGVGDLGAILGLVLAFATWMAKARIEESFLIAQFGDAYRQYSMRVKLLIPLVL
jgi:protein-S-isoprenylcysteine O-methyltransferase Ste14